MRCFSRMLSRPLWAVRVLLTLGSMSGISASYAQMAAMVSIDPSAPQEALSSTFIDVSTSLSKAMGQNVRVDRSPTFAEVLRSTRTGDYDIYIVPGHVAASALSHGYVLVAGSDEQETFTLITKPAVSSVGQLKGTRLYLPQQDSIHAYMAKGLLNEAGLSLREFGNVQYRNTSGAGLVAVSLGVADATVTRKSEYQEWVKTQSQKFGVLLQSRPVPEGLTVLVKNSMSESQVKRLAQWATSLQPAQSGLGRLSIVNDTSSYTYLGSLGNFTPSQLSGVARVTAKEAADLIKQGAQLADVRTEKEFNAKRIPGARLVPYVERSQKDILFDANLDDFSAAERLDKSKPTIFACNGAECWKSYKASKIAMSKGFKKVYWLRGGLPEWENDGLPLAK